MPSLSISESLADFPGPDTGPAALTKPVCLPTDQQTVVLLPKSSSATKTYLPIPVDHLEEEYRLRSADDGKLFREEFNVRSLGSSGFQPHCGIEISTCIQF